LVQENLTMICVIATIEVAPGRRDELLAATRGIVPKVRAEKGCIEYGPMIDVPSGLPAQASIRPDVVTMVEKWEGMAALDAHLKTPHMAEYFQRTENIRRGLSLQIIEPA
jgi:quinol monooxygenase YgiN